MKTWAPKSEFPAIFGWCETYCSLKQTYIDWWHIRLHENIYIENYFQIARKIMSNRFSLTICKLQIITIFVWHIVNCARQRDVDIDKFRIVNACINKVKLTIWKLVNSLILTNLKIVSALTYWGWCIDK
jgi:hypothetical protein